jgi:hypothetical protein
VFFQQLAQEPSEGSIKMPSESSPGRPRLGPSVADADGAHPGQKRRCLRYELITCQGRDTGDALGTGRE